jgi:hypothetical protein
VRSDLSEHESKRIADYHDASMLAEDDDIRRDSARKTMMTDRNERHSDSAEKVYPPSDRAQVLG